MKDIITLSVESSCDETSIAILKNGKRSFDKHSFNSNRFT